MDNARLQSRNDVEASQLYNPLDADSKEFRLLLLQQGTSDDVVCCELKVSRLPLSKNDEPPSYETISYCWGDAQKRDQVVVNGYNVNVPASSAAALRCMRLPGRVRTVWIDAICINQDDIPERNSQVQLMGNVFGHGQQNLVYLGQEEEIEQAWNAVRPSANIANQKEVSSSLEDGSHSGGNRDYEDPRRMGHLAKYIMSPWFQRVWTWQETLLARRNVCHCGTVTFELREVFDSIDSSRYDRKAAAASDPEIFERFLQIDMLGAGISRFKPEESNVPALLANVLYACVRQCSDLRDHVFGIAGLVHVPGLPIDYTKTGMDVYWDFADFMMRSFYEPADLIMIAAMVNGSKGSEKDSSIPSWVPQWHLGLSLTSFYQAQNFRVSSGTRPELELVPTEGSTRLAAVRVRGQLIGIVEQTTGILSFHEALRLTRDAFSCTGDFTEKQELALATTLTFGNQNNTKQNQLLTAHRWLMQREPGTEPPDLNVARYIQQLSIYDRGYCFMNTKEGRIGLMTQNGRSGDLIAMIYGEVVPIVLRKTENGYRILGLAYTHGLMNGEAVEQHDQRISKSTMFQIV